MTTNQVSRAAMSTGISKTFHWDQAENARAWAIREASMLIERNEPQHHECYAVPLSLMAHFDSGSILAEALAAFIAD